MVVADHGEQRSGIPQRLRATRRRGVRRLLAHFGSLRAVSFAGAGQIPQVRGFGPRRSRAIEAIATHRYRGAQGADGTEAGAASGDGGPARRRRRPLSRRGARSRAPRSRAAS
ncbi:MAG TPA: hypothetical protein VHF51_02200 [Solirubrobacteraceae bacterium]|nr:hypothetical protein [Solirubrobacteraceae bacterium]